VSINDRNKDQKVVIITGGARSGKSRFAQELAMRWETEVIFIATAAVRDKEMEKRIARHRQSRPRHWRTIEETRDLVGAIEALGDKSKTIIIDCITLWLSNLMEGGHEDKGIRQEARRLGELLQGSFHSCILVTNEVGSGIVPDNALARRFRDMAGEVNQILASCADECYLMAAGIPVKIKPHNRVA
jgi:adenosylcobinamide kinase/adenosylcobinamide-phosphate guanylyltransferase